MTVTHHFGTRGYISMKRMTQPTGELITIAIVDDDALAREGLKCLMQTDGRFQIVGEADDRTSLLLMARVKRPDIAMIDADLLTLMGMGAVADLGEQVPQTKVLLMGIHTSPETIIRSLKVGAVGYVQKSSSLEVFADACLQVARGVQPVLPEMASDLLWYMLEQQTSSRETRDDPHLTKRQYEVLQFMAQGMCNKEIAGALNVSETTVKSHVTGILRKLGVSDRTQAVVKALQDRIVIPDEADSETG